MKYLVLSNATVDAYLPASARVTNAESSVTIHANRRFMYFDLKNGEEVVAGGKYETKEILNKFAVLTDRQQWGGGGYNTTVSMVRNKRLANNGNSLIYLDTGMPSWNPKESNTMVSDYLQEKGVENYFLSLHHMPVNLVDGSRGDKIIYKSPINLRELQPAHDWFVKALMSGADQVVVNSVKSQELAEIIRMHDGLVWGVTTSLDPAYVVDRLVPNALIVTNYDELGFLTGQKSGALRDEKDIFSAVDYLLKLGKGNRMYVTMGKNGVIFSDNGQKGVVRLVEDDLQGVQAYLAENEKVTTGAGDAFLAGMALSNQSLPEVLAEDASRNSLDWLGVQHKDLRYEYVKFQ